MAVDQQSPTDFPGGTEGQGLPANRALGCQVSGTAGPQPDSSVASRGRMETAPDVQTQSPAPIGGVTMAYIERRQIERRSASGQVKLITRYPTDAS